VERISIDWTKRDVDKPIDPATAAVWRRQHEYHLTLESYEFLDCLKRREAKVSGVRISITGDRWAELNLHELVELNATELSEAIEAIRKLPVTGNGQVEITAGAIHFPTGQHLLDWLNEAKIEVKPGEVKQ
jgi:hypothetical protein